MPMYFIVVFFGVQVIRDYIGLRCVLALRCTCFFGGGGVAVETLFIRCYATTGYVSGKRANVRKSPSKSVIFADCIERDMGSVRVSHAAVVPFVVGVRRTLAAHNTTCPFLISGWICFFFSLIDVVGIKSTAIVFVRSLKKC